MRAHISGSVLCVSMLHAKNPYTIELILPVHTLTMTAPLSPTVVGVQLHFIPVRQQKFVPRGHMQAPALASQDLPAPANTAVF